MGLSRPTLIACLIAAVILAPGQKAAEAAPALLANSTSPRATANDAQRKSFYDSVNRNHWTFYYTGAAIEYARSSDGQNWTTVGTLDYQTPTFAVTYKTVSGVGYIALVTEAHSYDIVLKRGVLGSTSISFDPQVTVFDGTSESDKYSKPTVAINSYNRVWVGAIKDFGPPEMERYQPAVRESVTGITAALGSWASPGFVGRKLAALQDLIMLPQSGVDMYLLVNNDLPNIVGYRYNGTAWSEANTGGDYSWFAFPEGISGPVYALAVSGTNLYVAGDFTGGTPETTLNRVARWDGSAWHALGDGVSNGTVYALAVSAGNVYIGGSFSNAGGVENADRIARWNGSSWSALGTGMNNQVSALAVTPGGVVYATGDFSLAGGVSASRIASWNGTEWQALGTGLTGGGGLVLTLNGSDLYVGGSFTGAGGVANTAHIAKWTGAWSALGTGLTGDVHALQVVGTYLYAGGCFAGYLKRYNLTLSAWSTIGGSNMDGCVDDFALSGTDLYIGGRFTQAAGISVSPHLIKYDTAEFIWSGVGGGVGNWLSEIVVDGSGKLYVAGSFVPGLLEYDGSKLAPVSHGINGYIVAMKAKDSDLYVAGSFVDLGGIAEADYVARWDGTAWHAVGAGLNGPAYAITIAGDAVYVGGDFTAAGGVANTRGIARWEGSAWHALGTGITGQVRTIAVSGTTVYAGGAFTSAGGIANTAGIAKWNGSVWSPVGSGVEDAVFSIVPSANGIYVGGNFTTIGGAVQYETLAFWNTTSSTWQSVGTLAGGNVYAMALQNNWLIVGGDFATINGISMPYLAAYTGTWQAISGPLDNYVDAVTWADGDLYIGGAFTEVGSTTGTSHIAKWDGTNWHMLDNGLNGAVTSIAKVGSAVYASGGLSAVKDGRVGTTSFAKYALAAAGDAAVDSAVSAVTDGSGNVHLLYTDCEYNVKYRYYNNTTHAWGTSTALTSAGEVGSVAIAGNFRQDQVFAFWEEDNGVLKFSSSLAPFTTWTAPYTFFSNNINQWINTEPVPGYTGIAVHWTNGADTPYRIYGIVLPITYTISGTITHGGSPVSGVQVSDPVFGTRTTNAEGVYSFAAVPAFAQYLLTPNASGYTFVPTSESGVAGGPTTVNFSATSLVDTDGDGTIDDLDFDDDNDNLSDNAEEQAGTNPLDPDSDDDGTTDGQEVLDGSNPGDPGSNVPTLSSTVCSDWNGYLGGMPNIMEHVNLGLSPMTVETVLYDINGQAQGAAVFPIQPGAQFDLLVHDMSGWAQNSYGKVCSTVLEGSRLDGRMVYYHAKDGGAGDFDFAFAMPFTAGRSGSQYVPFNTFDPDLDPATPDNFAANWIQLTNLEDSGQTGTLYFYAQDGSVLATQPVTLAAQGRQDYSGHQFGVQKVGIIEWRPDSADAHFQMRNARYIYDNPNLHESFSGAFQLEGMAGTGELMVVPLVEQGTFAVVEVANVLDQETAIELITYHVDGTEAASDTFTLPARASKHVIVAQYGEVMGSATIKGAWPGSTIAVAMQYGLSNTGELRFIYGIQAKEALGSVLAGSYNTFLGQTCSLLLSNPGAGAADASILMTRYDGTVVLQSEPVQIPGHGALDYDLCSHENQDNYGVVVVVPQTANTITASLIRKKPDLRIPTPLRQ